MQCKEIWIDVNIQYLKYNLFKIMMQNSRFLHWVLVIHVTLLIKLMSPRTSFYTDYEFNYVNKKIKPLFSK